MAAYNKKHKTIQAMELSKYKAEVHSTQASCPLNYELKKKTKNTIVAFWKSQVNVIVTDLSKS